VVLANQAGGFAMLGLAWVIVRRLRADAAPAAAANALTLLALAWLSQAGLGAVSGVGTPAAAPLHLAAAVFVLPLALLSAVQVQQQGLTGEGRALLAVVLVQTLVGGVAVAHGAPAPLVLVHNACAAVGLALVTGLADAARSARTPLRV
jgi:heme A synthase